MPKPACIPCQRFLRPKKTGFRLIEGMPNGTASRAMPGTSHPEQWQPYKLWICDLYECEGCGAQIAVGYGRAPVAEHYQREFAETVERLGATVQINDC